MSIYLPKMRPKHKKTTNEIISELDRLYASGNQLLSEWRNKVSLVGQKKEEQDSLLISLNKSVQHWAKQVHNCLEESFGEFEIERFRNIPDLGKIFPPHKLNTWLKSWDVWLSNLASIRSEYLSIHPTALKPVEDTTPDQDFIIPKLFATSRTRPAIKDLREGESADWITFKSKTQPYAVLRAFAERYNTAIYGQKDRITLTVQDVLGVLNNPELCSFPPDTSERSNPKLLKDIRDNIRRYILFAPDQLFIDKASQDHLVLSLK